MTPSRQRQWQQRQHALGLCGICGHPVVDGWLCQRHLDYKRTYGRNRYRTAHGIPLDKPLGKMGRPRKG